MGSVTVSISASRSAVSCVKELLWLLQPPECQFGDDVVVTPHGVALHDVDGAINISDFYPALTCPLSTLPPRTTELITAVPSSRRLVVAECFSRRLGMYSSSQSLPL